LTELAVASVLIGASRKDQIAANARAASKLTADQVAQIRGILGKETAA